MISKYTFDIEYATISLCFSFSLYKSSTNPDYLQTSFLFVFILTFFAFSFITAPLLAKCLYKRGKVLLKSNGEMVKSNKNKSEYFIYNYL